MIRLLLAGCLATCGRVAADTDAVTTLPDVLIADITRDAERLVRTRKPPGLAVAVVIDGKVAWRSAWGRADLDDGRALSVATPFPLGDVSKLYTSVLALKLEAERRVDLDARLDSVLPDVRIASRFEHADPGAITLRQLLSQHAGLPPERWAGSLLNVPEPARAALPANDQLYLLRPPGELYGVSNVGFVLAGEWLARAAGMPFERAMTVHVLSPLELNASGYGAIAGRVAGHGKRRSEPAGFARDPAPSGMNASIDDLGHFLAALMPTKPGGASAALPAMQTRTLLSPQNDKVALDFDQGVGLGYSLYDSTRPGVGRVLTASSLHPNTFADVLAFPDHGLALAVLGNMAGDRGTRRFVRAFVDRLLEWRAGIPPRPDDGLDPPERIPMPDGVRPDAPAGRYSTLAGLVPVHAENDGFVADVMGWHLHARPRADGWHHVSWHLLGFIPIDPGILKRLLVRPVRAGDRRLLVLWLGGRLMIAGSTFQAPALEPRWRALAGRYRLRNADDLSKRMKLNTVDLEIEEGMLVFRYTLPLPMIRVRTRIPVVPLEPDRLLVPGFGATLGEQSRVHFRTPPRIEFAGYILEREP